MVQERVSLWVELNRREDRWPSHGGEDLNCRARKIEGGYESVLNWDEEELVVNYFPFDLTAEMFEKQLGRKPTPEEVEERSRELAGNPKSAIVATPPPPRPGEEGIGGDCE